MSKYDEGNQFYGFFGNGWVVVNITENMNRYYVLTDNGIYSKRQLALHFYHT